MQQPFKIDRDGVEPHTTDRDLYHWWLSHVAPTPPKHSADDVRILDSLASRLYTVLDPAPGQFSDWTIAATWESKHLHGLHQAIKQVRGADDLTIDHVFEAYARTHKLLDAQTLEARARDRNERHYSTRQFDYNGDPKPQRQALSKGFGFGPDLELT